mgnify:CR=1 FL=1
MNNFFRQVCFLKTELLPQEVPLFFSNNPITENIGTIFQKIDIIDSKDTYTIPLNLKFPKIILQQERFLCYIHYHK